MVCYKLNIRLYIIKLYSVLECYWVYSILNIACSIILYFKLNVTLVEGVGFIRAHLLQLSFLFSCLFSLNTVHNGRAEMYTLVSKCLWKIITRADPHICSVLAWICFCRIWIIMTFHLESQYHNYHLIILCLHICPSYHKISLSDALMGPGMGLGASMLSCSLLGTNITLLKGKSCCP